MVGWHHGLNGHEFEQTLGDGEGQGSYGRDKSRDIKKRWQEYTKLYKKIFMTQITMWV